MSTRPLRRRPRRAPAPALALALLSMAASAPAQDGGAPRVFRLQPEPMRGVDHGRVEVVRGEAVPEGHRFFLDGLNVLTPVSVTLMGADAAAPVELLLTKYAWDQPVRRGRTGDDGEGLLNFRFRTEGEFQATVRADSAGAPYQLVVWVGEEVEPQLRPVVVPASEYAAAPGPRWWLWSGLVLALLALALTAALVLRRKRA
ncbi:hypothetical protein QFW77_14105 [Luteimonas sp. RD2P54]|uniref:Uncharacterized protein n=1 Tax=Luteimonas endophytica TaxID=3042023 RepID=A0ABT6JBA6_9GAMM|nr:hypothetical protein [Luteimonas endophytica]MDH5824111.1 hypothetical protein [Luteimonas endophytica]